MNNASWTRIASLPLRWKIVAGGLLLFLWFAARGEERSEMVPPGVEPGAVLAGIQLPGEKPLFHDQGLHVIAVEGPWVGLSFGPDEKTMRWFNFQHVAGCMREPEQP